MTQTNTSLSTLQAQAMFNSIQASIVANRTARTAAMSAAFPATPTTPAPAPQPTQSQLTASLQDAAYQNDLNRFATLSQQLATSRQPQLQAQATTIPTSGGAWAAAQTMK